MKSLKFKLFFAGALALASAGLTHAADSAGKPKELTIEQRLADIEAYMNNAPRVKDDAAVKAADKAEKTNVPAAGPGHNSWIMTSTLLVLFMTLPGLALFYGGLVRTKNVLSVVAQCFGIAALSPYSGGQSAIRSPFRKVGHSWAAQPLLFSKVLTAQLARVANGSLTTSFLCFR